MGKVIDLANHRKKSKGDRKPIGQVLPLGSLEHVVISARHRGFILLADQDVPNHYSVMTETKALVGSCEFTMENRIMSFSLLDINTGKYLTRDVGRHAVTPVALTTLLLEALASL